MSTMETKNKIQPPQISWSRPVLDIQNTVSGLQDLKQNIDGNNLWPLLEQILRDDFKGVTNDLEVGDIVGLHAKSYENWSKGLQEESTRKQAEMIQEKISLIIEIGRYFNAYVNQLAKAHLYQLYILKEYAVMENLDSIYMFSINNKTDFWFILSKDERSVSLKYVKTFALLQDKYPEKALDFMLIEKSQLIVDEIPTYSALLVKRKGADNFE